MSDVSSSDVQNAGKDKIRARLRERSSRLLSLLGLRNPAHGAVCLHISSRTSRSQTNTCPLTVAKLTSPDPARCSKLESRTDTLRSGLSLPAETDPATHHTSSMESPTNHAHPTAFSTDSPSPDPESNCQEALQVPRVKDRQQTEIQYSAYQTDGPGGMRRSQSTPEAFTHLFSRKLSSTFGNPTVIRRAHLRSRPNIRAVQFAIPTSPPPEKDSESDHNSSNPSTPPSSSASPPGTQSTPPTSEEPTSSPDESKQASACAVNVRPSLESSSREPIAQMATMQPVPGTSPSIVTVEATANAKIFFETYFSTVYSGIDPRLQRQRELEEYICSSPITTEEKIRIRKQWILQEREYLRQCRVLKTRSHSVRNDKTVSIAGFEVIKVLGRGSFGVVRLVKERVTDEGNRGGTAEDRVFSRQGEVTTGSGETNRRRIMAGVKKDVFAMKVIRKSAMIRNCQEGHLRAERDFLVASAKSRWIVPLIASFQDNSYLYLIMDYMVGGDFLSLLLRQCILREDVAKWYVAEMILCVEEAHRLQWIHRDIKPDNFLISASGHLKISDFGLAFDGHWAHDQLYYNDHRYSLVQKLGIRVYGDAQDQKDTQKAASSSPSTQEDRHEDSLGCTTPSSGLLRWRDRNQTRRLARSIVGTSQYMAPEIIRGQAYDGRCDWWSIGIILYECLYGFTPFASNDRQKTKVKIHHHLQTLRFPMHRPSDKLVTGEAVDLINSLLQEKELRLSCNDYRQNDPPPARSPPRYLFYNIDAFGQDNRGFYVYTNDATDIKAHPFFRNINWDILHRTIPPFIPKVKGWEDTRYFDDWGNTQENGNTSNSSNMEDEVEGRPNPSQFDGQLSLNRDGGPAPDQKDNPIADVNSPARDRKKGKEKHRPRDKLLRDKRTGKTALEMRKKSAFLGYTYRRPKAVAMAFSLDQGRPYLPRGVLSELYGC